MLFNLTQEIQESALNSSPKKIVSRGKCDPAWGHYKLVDEIEAKHHIMCLYCNKVFKGGRINRFKQNLVGIKGDVE